MQPLFKQIPRAQENTAADVGQQHMACADLGFQTQVYSLLVEKWINRTHLD